MPTLPQRPWNAPRKRFRGQRRYFRTVMRRAEAFAVDTAPGAWWDFWHYHPDWPGWGNRAWRYRREHLRALAVVFRKVVAAGPAIGVPFQAWIHLDVDDAGADAVYIHSPNPNRSDFPFRPEVERWETAGPVHDLLAPLLPGLALRVGRCTWREQEDGHERARSIWLAYAAGVGVALE